MRISAVMQAHNSCCATDSMTRKKVSPEIYALSTIMFVVILSVILVSNAMESRSYRRDQKTLRKEGAR